MFIGDIVTENDVAPKTKEEKKKRKKTEKKKILEYIRKKEK